ncbi:MAG TPA: hypothetical protein VKZ53_30555 [Candidatus Angelobacter sp.]|nr:hypothetical protein [Candidatus Angelobacter sp.]
MVYRSIKPLLVDAVQMDESADIPTPGGVLHLKAGDWLLRDSQGNISRCDDVNFKCTYQAFPKRAQQESTDEGKTWGC